MNYYSTNNRQDKVSFRTALMQGLASDKGLFMPEFIPKIEIDVIDKISELAFKDLAFIVAQKYIDDEINNSDLENIINSSITFKAPVVKLSDELSILELFHGPTLAFKDFGARFMARTMEHFIKNENNDITILVATSGDTGSAVANGFLNVEGINVVVLFPKGKISKIQEKQITTLGNNITSLEVNGTFDDCQYLVKSAFVDEELKQRIKLSSANSINIGRLIPQSFYYFESFKYFDKNKPVVYSVPSGNLGNLTAGLFAKKMGLPIHKFIAATNSNDVFTEFINTGIFNPRASQITFSNAMDVGNPSNLARIIDLFMNDHSLIKDIIYSHSFSDEETIEKMIYIHDTYEYKIDPHGAVGCLALKSYLQNINNDVQGVVLETAHPAKFRDVFETNTRIKPDMPERLLSCLDKEGQSLEISNHFDDFKEFLMN